VIASVTQDSGWARVVFRVIGPQGGGRVSTITWSFSVP
jgi:hypothetical protein